MQCLLINLLFDTPFQNKFCLSYCKMSNTAWSIIAWILGSQLNYSCKLTTDQFSVLSQNNPNLFESQTQQISALQVQIDICSSSLHAEHYSLCFSLREHSHSIWRIFQRPVSGAKKCEENHFLLFVLESWDDSLTASQNTQITTQISWGPLPSNQQFGSQNENKGSLKVEETILWFFVSKR